MANTTAICTSFKQDLLNGVHAFSSAQRTADTFYAALYLASASLGAGTTAYTTSGELGTTQVSNGTAYPTYYTPGGVALTNTIGTSISGTTATWTPSSYVYWSNLSIELVDTLLIYNHTASGKNAVMVLNVGAVYVPNVAFSTAFPANLLTIA